MNKPSDLLDLIKEHPDLPVIPMVGSEIVADDTYCYWMASWGSAKIDRYLVGEESVHFYDESDEDEICQTLNDRPADCVLWSDAYDKTDEENLVEYKALPWIDAIIVYIETPH